MYDERERFSIKDVVLQVILVVLFVFLLLWLFPTKSYVDNAKDAAVNYTNGEIKKLAVSAPSTSAEDTGNKGDGAYLKTISQTDGKIKATKVKFATTFNKYAGLAIAAASSKSSWNGLDFDKFPEQAFSFVPFPNPGFKALQ